MSAARKLGRVGEGAVPVSTRAKALDMLPRVPPRPERGSMSAQREFSDGELIPGTRYRVVALIGAGGMGSVYEVEHSELGKRFVLKALLRSLTPRGDLVHRLRNEWRALGRLEHPNIVSVTDAGVTSTGLPYYVMERLYGETLAARLHRQRRVPLSEALTIVADVLDGLSAAHRIGIVHRDVKPPNVFLVADRPAKLLDFGIAKVLDPKASQITGRGIAIGTPRYMAPEQASGETVDARTDLYAVGLILFEMIAGAGPFDGARDSNDLFLAHLTKVPPLLSSAAPVVPAELDGWVVRLLAKKPAERPANAEAVASALRELRDRGAGQGQAPEPMDEATLTGGPFDTLEVAPTAPSAPPGPASRVAAQREAVTRTGMGPALRQDPARGTTDTRADDAASRAAALHAQSGATLRLDAVSLSGDEVATNTATPAALPGTPPPVSGLALPGPRGDRRRLGAAVAAVSLIALAAAFAPSLRRQVSPSARSSGALGEPGQLQRPLPGPATASFAPKASKGAAADESPRTLQEVPRPPPAKPQAPAEAAPAVEAKAAA